MQINPYCFWLFRCSTNNQCCYLFSRFDPSLWRKKLAESAKQLSWVNTWHLCKFWMNSHVLYLCKRISFYVCFPNPLIKYIIRSVTDILVWLSQSSIMLGLGWFYAASSGQREKGGRTDAAQSFLVSCALGFGKLSSQLGLQGPLKVYLTFCLARMIAQNRPIEQPILLVLGLADP